MDHGFELISPIAEILEIEVSNILYNPGNIVNISFFRFSPILEILEICFFYFPYPGNAGGGRAAPGVRLRGAWIIFGICSWNFRIS